MNRKDYTVGWLCALPLERAMAEAMLDEVHQNLPQLAHDRNSYTFGRIGPHNVIIFGLPAGLTGIGPTTSAAEQIRNTFTSLKFILLVGVGGGVPLGNDIRLGDLVVSQPTHTFGGVIQYDYGKLLQEGRFERTGFSNMPHLVLLHALANMKAKHVLKPPALSQQIQTIISKYPHLQERIVHQGVDNDLLFDSKYVHHEESDSTCEECDRSKLLSRVPRATLEPEIHYGLIASGNSLIRDSAMRDKLGKEYKILCFEMEAAGLANEFQCLVIRGICDYADSHKNKRWQPYAATVASLYAKDLLHILPAEASETRLPSQPGTEHVHTVAEIHNIPFDRNESFCGREAHISDLKSRLYGEKPARKVALYGLGGVGKTQIALEFAYQMLEEQPNQDVFWVVGRNVETLEQSYLGIANLLGIMPANSAGSTDVKSLVRQKLSQPDPRKWLMVVDNADDSHAWFRPGEDQNSQIALIDLLPKSPQGTILYTTRSREAAVDMCGKNCIYVQELTEESAESLLRSLLITDIGEEESLSSLVHELCYLPLALTQAAAYMNKKSATISQYLSLMKGAESELIYILSKDFEDEGRYRDSKNPIATTWLISFEQIRQQDPLAADYLSLMSCLELSQIPEILLPGKEKNAERLEAIGTLKAYSFITEQFVDITDLEDPKRYTVFNAHRLVHLSTRNWLRQKGQADEWIKKALRCLVNETPTEVIGRVQFCKLLLPHSKKVLAEEASKQDQQEYYYLSHRVCVILYTEGKFDEVQAMLTSLLDQQVRELASEDPARLKTMRLLGLCYHNQSKLEEANGLLLMVLEKKEQTFGRDHIMVLFDAALIADNYRAQGRLGEAEKYGKRAVEGLEAALSHENHGTMAAVRIVTDIYTAQGRLDEAEQLLIRQLEAIEGLSGTDSNVRGFCTSRLATVYEQQGRLSEAEDFLEQGLQTFNAYFGDQHLNALSVSEKLAKVKRKLNRMPEAIKLMESVYRARCEILGRDTKDSQRALAYLIDFKEEEERQRAVKQ